jgi:nucleotide-binding universal stress UspA family protein
MTEAEKGTGEILVAQDGSPAALAAATVGIQIAQSLDLSVHGLYVVDETLALETYADYGRELEVDSEPVSRSELLAWFEEQGDAALEMLDVRCQAADVPVVTELVAGGIPDMVLRQSKQAQLLAIGRRGHGHEGDFHHLGRSFRTIAHRAHLPVVIGGDEERAVRRVLLAYDASKHAQSALAWASQLQRTLPAEVSVVAVQENGQQATDKWLAEARSQLAGCQCVHRPGHPAHEIIAVAKETNTDLIVMGRYRHIALLEWFAGSTVDRVLRGTQLPILMV